MNMLVEQRTYTLVPGGTAEYVRVYEEAGRAIQERILGNLMGYFTRDVGELNQLVYLWSFDSMEERSRRRDELLADPDFKAFRARIRHLLVRQENSLLLPAGPRPSVETRSAA